eukprot:gene19442-29959_t
MDNLFASDKARLRPAPTFSFTKSPVGGGKADGLPMSSSPQASAKEAGDGAPSPGGYRRDQPVTAPVAAGAPHSRPTPNVELRSVPVHRATRPQAFNDDSPPARREDYAAARQAASKGPSLADTVGHTPTPMARGGSDLEAQSEHESFSRTYQPGDRTSNPVRSGSARRRATGGPQANAHRPAREATALSSSHRGKSPAGLKGRAASGAAPGAKPHTANPAFIRGPTGGKRRPTELEAAKDTNEKLKAALDGYKQEIGELKQALVDQQGHYEDELQRQHDEAQQAVDHLSNELDLAEQRKAAELAEKDRLLAAKDVAMAQMEEKMEEQKRLMQRRIDSITEEANNRMEEYEHVIEKFQAEVGRLEGVVQDKVRTIKETEEARDKRYQQYEEYLMIGEKSRAELHNALLELKGNIRVFARIRPMLEKEIQAKMGDPSTHFEFPEGTDHRGLHVVDVPGHQSPVPGKSEANKTLPFTFDKVFGPTVDQGTIFNEISQLIQSSLDGYKVCIFAYGQTGSGKTHTMEGPDPSVESDNNGMIPRAVNQIFDNCQWKSKQTGFTFRLLCSFLEIYNETVHDLLKPPECYTNIAGSGKDNVKHEIRIIDNEAVVTNVTEEEVKGPNHVYELLRVANETRKTEGTKMNERASRSHSVFIMKIRGYNEATRQEINGQLNLIDLAGSERLGKSKAEGDRLRETQHINKSLACLGDVIVALAKGEGSHVPFRQSKLTHLLQPSMTNDSKTLMFVNINPVKDHLHESICSLRFAAKVNACEIGIARRKIIT